jgi:hypothetical protein
MLQAYTDFRHLMRCDRQPCFSLYILFTHQFQARQPVTFLTRLAFQTDLLCKVHIPFMTPINDLDVYSIELTS